VPEGALIGVDPIPRMLEIARERAAEAPNGRRLEFREGPAERLPLEDGLADLVFAFDSFDHWQDQAAGLQEVRRVLRPEGHLVVVKDGGLAGGAKAKQAFVAALERAGFVVLKHQTLVEGEVSCTMWVCGVG
jgi:SAM-dependent methyltransferase